MRVVILKGRDGTLKVFCQKPTALNPSVAKWRPCTWVKPGRFGSSFVFRFLALGGHCLQMLCLPGFGTHANTQNRPHFRAFPAIIQEQYPPKCLFFMANAKLPNRPGFALLPVHASYAYHSFPHHHCPYQNDDHFHSRRIQIVILETSFRHSLRGSLLRGGSQQ